MDLDHAIEKHVEWKLRLRTAITRQETLDAATISKDNCCELGKWLYGDGKLRLGAMASYPACVARHAEFHAEAGKVAQAINGRKFAAAELMIGGDSAYANASAAVGAAIIKLKREAGL